MKFKNVEELIEEVTRTVNGITAKKAKEIDKSLDKYQNEIAESGKATQETIDTLTKSISDLKEKNEALETDVRDLLQKQVATDAGEPKEKNVSQQLKENSEKLKRISKGELSDVVVIKAVSDRASVANNPNALELAGVGQLAHARLTAYDIFRVIPVSESNTNGTIGYFDWDDATTVRAAAARAEGAAFPESEAKFIYRTIQIQKVGDSLPVTDEFFADSEMFAAELDMFLETNIKIKRNFDLINADGVSPNIKGVLATVTAFAAAASGIQDASIYDLLVKVSESITTTGGAKYQPDFVMMNKADINKMKLKKDANNNYIIPPFVSRDGKEVDSMIVLEENAMPAGQLVVGDSRYARIYEKDGIELSRGMVNNQFLEDTETLKARTRLAFLIRNVDLGGFRKVTDIDADLTTLETP